MHRRLVLWLVCVLAAALPLQSMASVARMACSPAASVLSIGSLDPHAMHRAASATAQHHAHGPTEGVAGLHANASHGAGCSACAACCVATAPPSPSLALASLPAPKVLAAEPVLPAFEHRTRRLERPPRPVIA